MPIPVPLFKALSDPTRVRILTVVRAHTLTVSELSEALELPQPRVSTHLRTLRDAGLVNARRVAGQAWYGLVQPISPVLKAALDHSDDPLLRQDLERARSRIRARQQDRVGTCIHRAYSPGRTWESLARALALLASGERVLDVAAGDGAVAELLAPALGHITCVDADAAVVDAARERLQAVDNLRFLHGDMHDLPFERPAFDRVLMLGALPYASDPDLALREAARVLHPGGRLTLTTLHRHPHRDTTERFGHRNDGHTVRDLDEALEAAGLRVDSCRISSRERRAPHFEILTAAAHKPESP